MKFETLKVIEEALTSNLEEKARIHRKCRDDLKAYDLKNPEDDFYSETRTELTSNEKYSFKVWEKAKNALEDFQEHDFM